MPHHEHGVQHYNGDPELVHILDQQILTAAQLRITRLEAETAHWQAKAEQAEKLTRVPDHALIFLDPAGVITASNVGATAILGYTEDALLGQSGDILFVKDDRESGLFVEEMCWALEEGYAANERWHVRQDGSRFWASGSMTSTFNQAGEHDGFLLVFRDNTAIRTEGEYRTLLLAEMGHRMKNTLATVQAVAQQTLRNSGVAREVRDTFDARLVALAQSHDLLTRNRWEGAALVEVLERVLLPYGDGERATLTGVPVWLSAQATERLGLAFHELATNAAKYGALSVPGGQIAVLWHLSIAADGTRLVHIVWRERGGPHVVPPTHNGFGSQLLEQGVVQDLEGTLKLAFHPEGLECAICLPITAALEASR